MAEDPGIRIQTNKNGEQVEALKVNDFSSDEETDEPNVPAAKSSIVIEEVLTEAHGADIDKDVFTEIAGLSDEELRAQLIANGVDAGPVTQTTRLFYQKKLIKMLAPDYVPTSSSNNGHSNLISEANEEPPGLKNGDFSADDDTAEEDDQPSLIIRKSSTPMRKTSARFRNKDSPLISPDTTDSAPSLRNRLLGSDSLPRKTIHSHKITEKSVETTVKTPDGKVARDYTYTKETSDKEEVVGGTSPFRRVLPVILLLIALASLAFYLHKIGSLPAFTWPNIGSAKSPPIKSDS